MELPAYANVLFRVITLVLVTATGYQYWLRSSKEAKRRDWTKRLTSIIDDVAPGPGGTTLGDMLIVYDEEDWADLYFELERMPRGRRSFARALGLIDAAGYSRAQRRLSPASQRSNSDT
jgi:hypothetical protein